MRDHASSESVLPRLKKIRAVYPEWARTYVPGHINGLQLKHTPIDDSWASDADDHWLALVAVVGREIPTARKNPPTRKKKERAVVEEEPSLVEADWPLLPITRGKTALIVGGAPKEPNRDRLETYLRLATLEWPLVDGPRKVEAVAQRIAKGAYDLVIVVQMLIGHPEAERILDAAKASRTRWAMADGYGATAVRQGPSGLPGCRHQLDLCGVGTTGDRGADATEHQEQGAVAQIRRGGLRVPARPGNRRRSAIPRRVPQRGEPPPAWPYP
jgi:hypothetical protein